MICTEENVNLLMGLLDSYGIEASDHQRTMLLKHLDLVVKKNRVMNLTRIVNSEDAIVRHVVDSLLLLPSFDERDTKRELSYVDIGTGAGFPGIPLGIMTEYKGTLIDSVGKKVNAVSEFIRELGLNDRLAAQSIRAEELAKKRFASFDVVTARAVADLGVLVEYASPLLKMGGRLIVSKARITDEETERGIGTGKLVGMRMVSRETYELPYDQGHREVLTLARDGSCNIKLPRQTGMAKHKPLVS